MWRTTTITILVLLTATLALGFTRAAPGDKEEGLRVGVYDSRAIAIAYASSEFNPVSERMKTYEEAKKAGDKKQMKKLEAWGEKHQRQLHRQGFSRVPVSDLLEHVKDRLPEVAKKTGIDVIAFECNYCGPGIEKVDITMELVKLYEPSERALGWVEDLRGQDPIELDELEQMGHEH